MLLEYILDIGRVRWDLDAATVIILGDGYRVGRGLYLAFLAGVPAQPDAVLLSRAIARAERDRLLRGCVLFVSDEALWLDNKAWLRIDKCIRCMRNVGAPCGGLILF